MTRKNENITERKSTAPTYTVCKKLWNGKRTEFETLGVAWKRDDGGLYIKLHGTQIIDGAFYVFPNKEKTQNQPITGAQ